MSPSGQGCQWRRCRGCWQGIPGSPRRPASGFWKQSRRWITGPTWRRDGYDIQVDHVYPLAAAWAAGAWAWPQRRRLRFANDVRRELLAVSADANQAKGAATPSQWLPPRGRCGYLGAYLRVAVAYDLPITAADARVVRRVATRC